MIALVKGVGRELFCGCKTVGARRPRMVRNKVSGEGDAHEEDLRTPDGAGGPAPAAPEDGGPSGPPEAGPLGRPPRPPPPRCVRGDHDHGDGAPLASLSRLLPEAGPVGLGDELS